MSGHIHITNQKELNGYYQSLNDTIMSVTEFIGILE